MLAFTHSLQAWNSFVHEHLLLKTAEAQLEAYSPRDSNQGGGYRKNDTKKRSKFNNHIIKNANLGVPSPGKPISDMFGEIIWDINSFGK